MRGREERTEGSRRERILFIFFLFLRVCLLDNGFAILASLTTIRLRLASCPAVLHGVCSIFIRSHRRDIILVIIVLNQPLFGSPSARWPGRLRCRGSRSRCIGPIVQATSLRPWSILRDPGCAIDVITRRSGDGPDEQRSSSALGHDLALLPSCVSPITDLVLLSIHFHLDRIPLQRIIAFRLRFRLWR
jgi:hypothetical protein